MSKIKVIDPVERERVDNIVKLNSDIISRDVDEVEEDVYVQDTSEENDVSGMWFDTEK